MDRSPLLHPNAVSPTRRVPGASGRRRQGRLGQAILVSSHDLFLRVTVSLLLALPAALAGFGMTLGFSGLGDMGAIPAYIFATFGALCVGGAAWTRLCAIQPA
nr:hypothetical protein [Acidomonas methanolica]